VTVDNDIDISYNSARKDYANAVVLSKVTTSLCVLWVGLHGVENWLHCAKGAYVPSNILCRVLTIVYERGGT